MNSKNRRDYPRDPSEEAARWLDEASSIPSRRAAFFKWLTESPQHVYELLMLGELSYRLSKFDYRKFGFRLHSADDSDVVQLPASRAVSLSRPPWRRSPWLGRGLIAASLGAFLLASGIILRSPDRPTVASYSTALGEIRHVTLNDGSHVALNTETEIAVDFTGNKRSIVLRRGEADFTVAPQPNRPFIVLAGANFVQAIGTQFSVQLHPDNRADVIVTSGRVAVRHASGGTPLMELSRNDRAIVSGREIVQRQRLPTGAIQKRHAWTSGRLFFVGEPLDDAVREFNRYNRRKLIVADGDTGQVKVAGSFPTDRPDVFADSLEALEIFVIAKSEDVLVLGNESRSRQ